MGYRIIFIKNGDRLGLKLDNLEVTKQGDKLLIPLSDIDTVVLEGDQTHITTRLLAKFAQNHIVLVVCNHNYLPVGCFTGMGQFHRSAKRAQWQAGWDSIAKQSIWSEIIKQKISNQIQMATWARVDEERLETLEQLHDDILLGDASNREGHAAKVYFNSLYGVGFTREEKTIENYCMDYGYTIIRAQMARIVASLGLLPMLGVFHKNEYNSYNLVDDLMEPFRPLMDYHIHQTILSKDAKYLTYEHRIRLIDFLNRQIMLGNKKIFLTQAMMDFVNSFISAMETEKYESLKQIQLSAMMECEKNEV